MPNMNECSTSLKPINVSIRNFQSIAELDFEVSGLTVVVGKSNIGKSAILRAISDSILNAPVAALVRKGSKFCSVEMKSKDWEFRWEKGGGVSRYFIPIANDRPLDKVGAGQIEPIAQMGFQSVKIGRKESHPWYANQFDPLFLLNETGSSVTDFISEVSQLQILQDAITISARDRKHSLDEIRVRTDDLEQLNLKINQVDSVSELEKISGELLEQLASIEEYEAKVLAARGFFDKLEKISAAIILINTVTDLKIPEAEFDEVKKLRSMHDFHQSLTRLALKAGALKAISDFKVPDTDEIKKNLEDLRRMNEFSSIEFLQKSVRTLSGVDSVTIPELYVEDDLGKLKKAVSFESKIEKMAGVLLSLKGIPEVPEVPETSKLVQAHQFSSKIRLFKEEIEQVNSQVLNLEAELQELDNELSKIPTCPTCGRVSSHSHSSNE